MDPGFVLECMLHLCALPLVLEIALGKTHSLNKRGILELAGAIGCATGRSPFAYLSYGCYCGLGGRGWPMDKADWCCFTHDCCYGKAENIGCAPKTEGYKWECEDKAVTCESLEDKCQKISCECDRDAVECLANAPYEPKYIFWPDFVCGQTKPQCEKD
uniref:Phospholipase A2 n=1 Tax=Sphenodon punctatus TaxID=8508 RepID=A0A8D0GS28_SPHPU